MTLENLKYYDEAKTIINGDLNGVYVSIPCSPGNVDYDRIVAEKLTVADYVKVVTWPMIRGKRNQLLRDTDWQAGTDVTMSDAQKAYRKKLRDLPATNADPTKIVFPDAP
tara:strand:- start:304 stop:633 length:330 start_codon:yes stop_codon:yes gene_type:complete